jgi:ferrous iron transport protein B
MYVLSTVSALAVGALYKRTLLRSPTPPLVLELPPYRLPSAKNVLARVGDKTWDFIRDAGTTILVFTIILWGLLSYPKVDPASLPPDESPIQHTYGGRVGRALEPVLEPIGQDWRMGVAIVGSFSAREVFVSTLGLVYGIEGSDEDDRPLREKLREAKDPVTGKPTYTPLTGVALMVFFVYACQCMSTIAVVARESRSWRWAAWMFVSMTLLAWVAAFLVMTIGHALGFG